MSQIGRLRRLNQLFRLRAASLVDAARENSFTQSADDVLCPTKEPPIGECRGT